MPARAAPTPAAPTAVPPERCVVDEVARLVDALAGCAPDTGDDATQRHLEDALLALHDRLDGWSR